MTYGRIDSGLNRRNAGSYSYSQKRNESDRSANTRRGIGTNPNRTLVSANDRASFNDHRSYAQRRDSHSASRRASSQDLHSQSAHRANRNTRKDSAARTNKNSGAYRSQHSGSVRKSSIHASKHAASSNFTMSSQESVLIRIANTIWSAIKAVFLAIGRGFTFIWSKSKIAGSLILAIVFVVCLVALDSTFTNDRIYKGVSIGDVDVSNMSVAEAAEAVNSHYTNNLYSTSVYIFADEEAKNSADVDLHMLESESLAEQISFEDAQKEKKLWITSANALEASVPSEELAEKALTIGRETGFFDRVSALTGGYTLPVYANFDETQLTNLIADINATLGDPVVDYDVEFDGTTAVITNGNVGYVLDNEEFSSNISDILLADDSSILSFVPDIEYTLYKIDKEKATLTANSLNSLLPDTVKFTSDDEEYSFNKDVFCKWITTSIEEGKDGYYLNPSLDSDKAAADILQAVNSGSTDHSANFSVPVTFIDMGDRNIYVQPQSDVSIPNIEEAVSALDESLFSEFRETLTVPDRAQIDPVPIQMQDYSGSLPIEEALQYGLVTKFSLFTTNYTNTTSTANRTFNIHKAADLIGSTIVKADGGTWSFNDLAGSCNEENGFREAGVIESGEYTTGIGGGICQVATTVFNAVYQSGLPINERHNHTLYSASYPAGRDAAIAYPIMDFVWTNDTSSDILLRTSYTDTSITVSLVGRNPGLTVETKTGEWVDGEKYSTKYEIDENLAANASYIKTAGTNGMSISVVRTVKDKDGNVVRENTYSSTYSPITRVIAFGNGTDMEVLRSKYSEQTNDQTTKKST